MWARLGWCALLLALGCEPEIPFAPTPDGSIARDGGMREAGAFFDAGPPQPIVDGVVTDAEWANGVTVLADVPTDQPGSSLHALRARVRDHQLFVAIEGQIATGDVMMVYVDRALDIDDGSAAPADHSTELNAQLSRSFSTPAGFHADFAWGTTALSYTAVGDDAAAGWRNLLSTPTSFGVISADTAPTVCGATACETSIPFSTLGGTMPRTIALFARLARGDGALTNQTLPHDAADMPSNVTTLLMVPDGDLTSDGGIDGGPDSSVGPRDAGPVPIRIDGVLTPGEWDDVPGFITGADTAGTPFEGSALTRLRAVRDSAQIYLAIEGHLLGSNAIAVYVDANRGSVSGLIGGTLTTMNYNNDLNRSISKYFTTPGDVRIDFAWGTTQMPIAETDGDPNVGWRLIATPTFSFTTVPVAGAPTVCSAMVCETSILLTTLGTSSSDTIALFTRLVANSTDPNAVSNQTLPEDNPSAPQLVVSFLSLPPP